MAEDVQTQVEDRAEVEEENLQEQEEKAPQTNAEAAAALAGNLQIPDVDFNDPNRESLKPRLSREGKVLSNGFKIPGFSSMYDLPGKTCVDCGFNAMKFSTSCPRCGGELRAEQQ